MNICVRRLTKDTFPFHIIVHNKKNDATNTIPIFTLNITLLASFTINTTEYEPRDRLH